MAASTSFISSFLPFIQHLFSLSSLASLSPHQLSIWQTPQLHSSCPFLPSLPYSILLRPIKSYHEANCLFDQLSMDQELEAFSPLSVRGETDEARGIYGCVGLMRLTRTSICWLVYFILLKFVFFYFHWVNSRTGDETERCSTFLTKLLLSVPLAGKCKTLVNDILSACFFFLSCWEWVRSTLKGCWDIQSSSGLLNFKKFSNGQLAESCAKIYLQGNCNVLIGWWGNCIVSPLSKYPDK